MQHSDVFALECQKISDTHMDMASSKIADIFSTPIDRIKPKSINDIEAELAIQIARTLRKVSNLSEQEVDEFSNRSFAIPSSFVISAADFYSKYIPALSGNITARTMLLIGNKIRKGEKEGLSAREISENLSGGFGLAGGHAKVVVRTEGTRAASFSRRGVAYRAAAQGRPPARFIYKSLLDNRTTGVCKILHNRWWTFAQDSIDKWPPQHFSCRAGVIFDWSNEDDLYNMKRLVKATQAQALSSQHLEFPTWVNQSHDILLDPDQSFRELLNTINGSKTTSLLMSDSDRFILNKRVEDINAKESRIVKEVKQILSNNKKNNAVAQIIREELETKEKVR